MARTSQQLVPSDIAPAYGTASSKVSKPAIPMLKPLPKAPTNATRVIVYRPSGTETETSKKRKAILPKSKPVKKKREETKERVISGLSPGTNIGEKAHDFQKYYFKRTKPGDAKSMLTSDDHQILTQYWKVLANDVDKPPLPDHLQRYHHRVWIDVEKTLRYSGARMVFLDDTLDAALERLSTANDPIDYSKLVKEYHRLPKGLTDCWYNNLMDNRLFRWCQVPKPTPKVDRPRVDSGGRPALEVPPLRISRKYNKGLGES